MKILITGGSGSIGSHLCEHLLNTTNHELHVLSNDILELSLLKEQHPDIDVHFCDIRDVKELNSLCKDIDMLIHLAAFKYAPQSELFIEEVYSTNVGGTKNVLDAALANNIKTVLNISSDKSVNPLGFYAKTKRIGELLTMEYSQLGDDARFMNLRFGNVFNSKHSVVPIVLEQMRLGKPVTITDPRMVRYYISMDDVCSFIIHSMDCGENGVMIIPKNMVQIKTGELIDALIGLSGKSIQKKVIGFRPGEKLQEDILFDFEKDGSLFFPLLHGSDIVRFIEDAGVDI